MESSPAFLPEKELMDSPASLTFFCKSFGYLPTLNILLRISLAISLGIPTGIFIGKLMFFHDFFQDFLREFILQFLREYLDGFVVHCLSSSENNIKSSLRKPVLEFIRECPQELSGNSFEGSPRVRPGFSIEIA